MIRIRRQRPSLIISHAVSCLLVKREQDVVHNIMGSASSETLARLSMRETFASFLFALCSLSLLLFSHSSILSPLRATYTRNSIHLTFLIPLLLVYDLLHLSLDSTLNPALALSVHLIKPQPLPNLLTAIVSQTVGHTLAVALLRIPRNFQKLLLPLSPASTLTPLSATFIEMVLTFSLAFTMLLSTQLRKTSTKLVFVIPVVVSLIAWGTDWTGPCMNPALAFALAWGFRSWDWMLVYGIGPMIGAVAAAVAYQKTFSKHTKRRNVKRKIRPLKEFVA